MPDPTWQAVTGWFDEEDAAALCGLLSLCPEGGATAHVGLFEGRHLAACADVLREHRLSVLAVDTWRGSDEGYVVVKDGGPQAPEALHEQINWTAVAIQFGRTLAVFGRALDVSVTTRGSLYAAGECRRRGQHFDLIFLDADHGYEHVTADIMAWRPLLNPGGVMAGHDWDNPDYPGVRRAVDEQLPGAWCAGGQVWGWANPR